MYLPEAATLMCSALSDVFPRRNESGARGCVEWEYSTRDTAA
jgi:hypothetical protein